MVSAGKRVLIIVQNLPVPFDRRVWLEATTLARHGYGVSVICPKAKGFSKSFERIEDVEIYRYSMPVDPSSRLGFVVEFGWALLATALLSVKVAWRGRGFDIIHACNPPETYWVLGRAWGWLGRTFIFDHHDLSPEMYIAKFGPDKGAFIHRALLYLERKTFETAQVALATNESHRSIAIERGGMSPEDVYVVRSGPDVKRLTVSAPDLSWGFGKEHVIVYLGDISNQDGVDGLVRIIQRLSVIRDDFHVVVVGGGSALEDVIEYADANGMGDLFTFTGVVSDQVLSSALSSATVAVDPAPKNSWTDKSTMNKIMEYMFFGLPIVAFDLTETRRSASGAAILIADGREESFADELSSLMDDAERRGKLSTIGRARVANQLAWEYSIENLLAAYNHVFESGRGRIARCGRSRDRHATNGTVR